ERGRRKQKNGSGSGELRPKTLKEDATGYKQPFMRVLSRTSMPDRMKHPIAPKGFSLKNDRNQELLQFCARKFRSCCVFVTAIIICFRGI
ncbi:MAG: hypothetical protein WAO13_13675, partial [Pseudolabrys sp.]